MGLLEPRLQDWVRLGETEGGVKSTCVCVCVCVCVCGGGGGDSVPQPKADGS